MKGCLQRIVILTMTCSMLHADTITTRGKVSVNGTLVKMADGELTVVASYKSEKKTLIIKKADVAIIEFNETTSNSEPPSKAIGLGPPLKESKPTTPPPEVPGTIVLWVGMQRRACNLIGIDEKSVHCAEKDGNYSRDEVLRIVLAGAK